MSDLHNNTTTFAAARAASRYLDSSEFLERDDTLESDAIEPNLAGCTVIQTPVAGSTGTTKPDLWLMGGMAFGPVMTMAATLVALQPASGGGNFTWNVGAQTVVVYDRRERDDARKLAEASVADKVVLELAKLENGWAGEGTVAPSKKTIEEIGAVLDLLPANVAMPLIEVEEEDGAVSLRWIAANGPRSFSLVCRGAGRVTGVVATIDPPRSTAWSAYVTDDVQIASKVEDQIADGIFAG